MECRPKQAMRPESPRPLRHVIQMPSRVSPLRSPAVSKAGVVFDTVETGIAVAELLADALDKGSYIGAIALCAVTGDEVLAVDKIIYIAIADVLPRVLG